MGLVRNWRCIRRCAVVLWAGVDAYQETDLYLGMLLTRVETALVEAVVACSIVVPFPSFRSAITCLRAL